jgi:uncharacterized membrane protein
MKMTHIGISSSLLSAICYFFGWYSLWVATALMILILILKMDSTVKRNAIQSVVTFGSLVILKTGYDRVLSIFERATKGRTLAFDYWVSYIYAWFLFVVMLYCILYALKEKIVFIPVVSEFVNKNIDQLD